MLDKPPVHERCLCVLAALGTVLAGTATSRGKRGADFAMFYYKVLPDEYITKDEARALGWGEKIGKRTLKLYEVAPNKMIGGEEYRNDNDLLPMAFGRIWFYADLEMVSKVRMGRNTGRLVYSNDGLIFVTYDHYHTFLEVVGP